MSLRLPGERDKRSRFSGHSRVRLWADITRQSYFMVDIRRPISSIESGRQTQCWR